MTQTRPTDAHIIKIDMQQLLVELLRDGAVAPHRASEGAAGYDVRYCPSSADNPQGLTVPARGRVLVPTGIAVAIPPLHYGRLAPRSGLAVRSGLDVGAGVIDEDYRGEVHVLLFNFSDAAFTVDPGERIAQLVLERISTPPVEIATRPLSETARGAGGFGSTGTV